MAFKPSKYQTDIYNWISKGSGNAIIQAVAGSGKTSTIVEATKLIPVNQRVLFLAFNKNIQEELVTRLPKHIYCKTLHAFGLSLFNNNTGAYPRITGDKVETIINEVTKHLEDWEKREFVQFLKKVISPIKNTLIDYTSLEQVMNLMSQFNINDFELDDRAMSFIRTIMQKNNANTNEIDFDDMIYLPVVLNFKSYSYDWVFVDESQDLNKTQFELIKRIVSNKTRVVAVGDKRQSIYAFRGADTNSMDNFKEEFNTTELPLSICYRCPKAHIDLVKQVIPEINIEAKADAIEGELLYCKLPQLLEQAEEKDLILCRTNAPLVKVAFALIRVGKKAVVRGRDIGTNLLKMIDKYKCSDVSELYSKLKTFKELQEEKLSLIEDGKLDKNKKGGIVASIDSVETLYVLMEDCSTIQDIKDRIQSIFTDQKEGIICSSVHKAKGLEADNVAIINYDNMPHPMAKTKTELEQEYNILYVALTRSKHKLSILQDIIK